MDWLQKMNGAINYIEENLTSDIDYNIAAKKAFCSVYHFQRMFSFILDIPLSEYIRRRRLTIAAFEVLNSNMKVIDIALKYGYDSPDSFTRAFHKLHGVTPTTARKEGTQLKAYPRISFQISIKGDVEMNYRIVETEAFSVFGKSIKIGTDENPCKIIPKLWNDFQEDGTYGRLCKTAGFEPYSGISLNAAFYDFENDGSYRNKYMIYSVLPGGKELPPEFESLIIPSSKWVVFSGSYNNVEASTEVIQNLWKRAFSEWFPTSEYEVVEGPQLEVYPNSSNTVEVWIPISNNNSL